MLFLSNLVFFAFPLASLVAAQTVNTAAQHNITISGVPILAPKDTNAIVPDKYIVVFKPDTPSSQIDAHLQTVNAAHSRLRKRGLTTKTGVHHQYGIRNFKAYSGEFDASTLKKIHSSSSVKYIEAVTVQQMSDVQEQYVFYNLARISHTTITQSPYQYLYPSTAGANVTAYIIDTGIDITHPDFQGRATWGANFASDYNSNVDGVGHGTHCAGIVGSSIFGVCKQINLVAVKVLNGTGQGDSSGVLAGVNWVANNKPANTTVVVNMSLGGGYSSSLNDGVNNLVASGAFVAVAAGNAGVDAGQTSPACASSAVAVGAIDQYDNRPTWSNYGPIVKVWAPGVGIISTWPNDEYYNCSGTSMASPHVAGLAALTLSQYGNLSPAALLNVLSSSTSGGDPNTSGNPGVIFYDGGESGIAYTKPKSSSTSSTIASSTSTTLATSTSSSIKVTSTSSSTRATTTTSSTSLASSTFTPTPSKSVTAASSTTFTATSASTTRSSTSTSSSTSKTTSTTSTSSSSLKATSTSSSSSTTSKVSSTTTTSKPTTITTSTLKSTSSTTSIKTTTTSMAPQGRPQPPTHPRGSH